MYVRVLVAVFGSAATIGCYHLYSLHHFVLVLYSLLRVYLTPALAGHPWAPAGPPSHCTTVRDPNERFRATLAASGRFAELVKPWSEEVPSREA